jgi:hypothetical protein
MNGLKLLRMVAFAGVMFVLPVHVFSFGKRDAGNQPPAIPAPAQAEPPAPADTLVEVSGRVRLVGSEPFPELVLTDSEEQTWYISPDDRKTLSGYEQQIVTIRGTVKITDMVLANGKSLGSRKTLSGITLVK